MAFVLIATLASACGTSGLNFRKDERVTITEPQDRAKVRLPLTVTWTSRDFDVTGRDGSKRPDAGYFGVYVDRAPQPPEKTQAWLARIDQRCKGVPSCPDEEYLAGINVYGTTKHSFTVQRLPQPPSNAPRRREFHEVTIVLLNGAGERIGESAFTIEFEVERE